MSRNFGFQEIGLLLSRLGNESQNLGNALFQSVSNRMNLASGLPQARVIPTDGLQSTKCAQSRTVASKDHERSRSSTDFP